MNLYELGLDLLTECESLLDPHVTGRDLPARRYVGHGEPPVESCAGLLAVWFGPLEVRQISRGDTRQVRRVASVNVDVWRCWPTGDREAPTVDELTGASVMVADDCDRLTGGLPVWASDGCTNVEWRPALPLGPNGGMAGWRIPLLIDLG